MDVSVAEALESLVGGSALRLITDERESDDYLANSIIVDPKMKIKDQMCRKGQSEKQRKPHVALHGLNRDNVHGDWARNFATLID